MEKIEPVAWMKDMGHGVFFDQIAPVGGYFGMCQPLYPQATVDQLVRERDEAYNAGVDAAARIAYGTGDEQMEAQIRALKEMK